MVNQLSTARLDEPVGANAIGCLKCCAVPNAACQAVVKQMPHQEVAMCPRGVRPVRSPEEKRKWCIYRKWFIINDRPFTCGVVAELN